MAKTIQFKRGTTAQTNFFAGALGEVTVDTDKDVIVVHDGVTAGGFSSAARANTDGSVSIIAKDGTILSTLHAGTKLVDYTPIPYPKTTPPTGYLMLMGQSILETAYPILFSLYGSVLPDLRGEFIRGWDNSRGVDAGRGILSSQTDDLKSHDHQIVGDMLGGNGTGVSGPDGNSGSWFKRNSSTNFTGGLETRPRNIAFNYIVKAG